MEKNQRSRDQTAPGEGHQVVGGLDVVGEHELPRPDPKQHRVVVAVGGHRGGETSGGHGRSPLTEDSSAFSLQPHAGCGQISYLCISPSL